MINIKSAIKIEKARYILVYYYNDVLLEEDEIKRKINSIVTRIYGLNGSISMGIYISWVHNSYPIVLIRISHKYINNFYACFLFLREINLIPIKLFGSIKKGINYANSINWDEINDDLRY